MSEIIKKQSSETVQETSEKTEAKVETKVEAKPIDAKEHHKDGAHNDGDKKTSSYKKSLKPMKSKSFQRENTGFEEKVVKIKRISKTTKGGRSMRFSALVVVGDRKGTVGFGMGKSIEVPDAIKKAIKNANNNLIKVKINKNGTVYHETLGHHGAGKVLIKPAPKGIGIIAGGPVRAVIELAGYSDIYTKSQGSKTPINVIRATMHGLESQMSPKDVARLRDKDVKDL